MEKLDSPMVKPLTLQIRYLLSQSLIANCGLKMYRNPGGKILYTLTLTGKLDNRKGISGYRKDLDRLLRTKRQHTA